MTIETDAERIASYFNASEHGTTATIDGTPDIPCLYQEAFELLDFEGSDVESGAPTLTCNTSAVTGVAAGAAVTVNGDGYTVRRREASNNGVTVLILNKT